MRNNPITMWAVQWITSRLRKDKDWYNAYQSNIAMAFYDEAKRSGIVNTKQEGDEKTSIHKIANRAATNFMDMWIKK